jgi:sulfatase modifying factor 1
MGIRSLFLILMTLSFCINTFAKVVNEVAIKGGVYTPFFEKVIKGKKKKILIDDFLIDETPVTNRQFLEFVLENKDWARSNVKNIFAENRYLFKWREDFLINPKDRDKAVNYVSWFSAMAYCESKGKTLPSIKQWEYIASADEKQAFAIGQKKYREKILTWYSESGTKESVNVGQGKSNYYGVKDLHGLHWEWNLDFNSSFVTGESREDTIINNNKFCGSGSLNAKDKLDYGAFMRFGFRSSLRGNYTIGNLGFRCARKGLKNE